MRSIELKVLLDEDDESLPLSQAIAMVVDPVADAARDGLLPVDHGDRGELSWEVLGPSDDAGWMLVRFTGDQAYLDFLRSHTVQPEPEPEPGSESGDA